MEENTVSVEEQVVTTPEFSIDIEGLKDLVASQPITDISKQMAEDVITATHFETEEVAKLQSQVRQIYLIDLSQCEALTEQWLKGLNSLVIGSNLADINEALTEINKERFSHGLLELVPDTALTLNIRVTGEDKTLFIGYIDSNQAYRLLGNFVKNLENAKLYKIADDKLYEVKESDVSNLRVHV